MFWPGPYQTDTMMAFLYKHTSINTELDFLSDQLPLCLFIYLPHFIYGLRFLGLEAVKYDTKINE